MCVVIRGKINEQPYTGYEAIAYKKCRFSPKGGIWYPQFRSGKFRTNTFVTALNPEYGFNVYAKPGRGRIQVKIRQIEGVGFENQELVLFAREMLVPKPQRRK